MEPYDRLFKVLLIGDSSVGKTCILNRFADSSYSDRGQASIGVDFKIRTVECRGKRIKLQLWDTAGQERFHNITKSYYRRAHGVMLVYDITNPESFAHITRWIRGIEQLAPSDIVKMLIGSKCDLGDRRSVGKEAGQQLALDHGVHFVETSAKANINIDEAFFKMAELMVDTIPKEADRDKIDVEKREEEANGWCCS